MNPATEGARVKARRVNEVKAELADMIAGRDRAIREAYAGGETIAELARATGITRAMLYRILQK